MKKLQLKPPHGRLVVQSVGEVTNDNITPEIYARLLQISPGHADFFHEVDVPEVTSASKDKKSKSETTKPENNGNDIQA